MRSRVYSETPQSPRRRSFEAVLEEPLRHKPLRARDHGLVLRVADDGVGGEGADDGLDGARSSHLAARARQARVEVFSLDAGEERVDMVDVVTEESARRAHGGQGPNIMDAEDDLAADLGREPLIGEGGVSHGEGGWMWA